MNCVFCDIVAKRRASMLAYEDEQIYAFHDIHPQAPTHILLVPKKHIATLNDLTDEDALVLGRITLVSRDIARDRGIADQGFRLVVNCNPWAGQTIYHVHFHLLGGRTFHWPPG
jgi:histidine triad (HIT) family protein